MTSAADTDDIRISSAPTFAIHVSASHLDHVIKINDSFHEQIKSSDQKAAYIFTIMLAFLATTTDRNAAISIGQFTRSLNVGAVEEVCFALASIVAFVGAIMVVIPRHIPKSTSLYWRGWKQHREILRGAAQTGDRGYLFDQYIENADVLALIAGKKSWWVGVAFRGLLVAALSYVAMRISF
ncbi:Pycsar system effector family protein [Rhizobium sp. HT1-10]|uniref:Pycsar system effector family protein n=1 Tax=Rhizobium sp. HT1-10 TaxID=3111638 RepID=UPI003C1DC5C4